MRNQTKIKLAFGVLLTGVIIFLSIKTLGKLHPKTLMNIGINWFLVAVSIIIYAYSNYVRALCFTRGIDRGISRMPAFQIVAIGHAANMVLPLHLGEGLRFFFFPAQYSTLRRTKLILITGYADFIAIMFFSVLSVPFAGFQNRALVDVLWLLFWLCAGGTVLSLAAVFFIKPLHRYFGEYLNFSLVKMIAWALLSWFLLLISTWVGLAAFGFGWFNSIKMSLAVFAATNIINFIPASPGAIGLFESGCILGLGGLGVDSGTALAASLLLHVIQYIALLPMAAVLLVIAMHGKYGQDIRNSFKAKKGLKGL